MKVIERIITVEYIDPKSSRKIAGKFPDATVYDFDYQQSGIWSPLLPRGNHALPSSILSSQRRKQKSRNRLNQSFADMVTKPAKSAMNKKRKKMKEKALNFSLACPDTPQKSWYRLFGVASKYLKKKQNAANSLQIGMSMDEI